MNKLICLVAAWVRVPVNNSLENTWHTICSCGIHSLNMLIWMILLIGMVLPELALANCEGTGPCYCYGSVCSNTPPPSNSSGGSGSSGSTSQDQMLIQGAGMLGKALGDALRGNPEEDARRQAEAARAAELRRQAEEQRKAEEMRQQEAAKQRILGSLKGTEPSTGLALKMGNSDTPLVVTETRGAFGSTAITPVRIDAPPAEHGLQLKLGDDADRSSMQAGKGFDTTGKIMNDGLPPPPPLPSSSLPDEKLKVLNILRASLKKNMAEEQLLKNQLNQLQQAPTPDPVAIGDVKEKIVVKEKEKRKIILDLTADDPDVSPPDSKGATPAGATITGGAQ
jgi:hypothetical protein